MKKNVERKENIKPRVIPSILNETPADLKFLTIFFLKKIPTGTTKHILLSPADTNITNTFEQKNQIIYVTAYTETHT